MPATLLQMVQDVCDELGLNRPAVAIASTDLQIRQITALMKRELREIEQNYDFTRLQTEYDLHVSPPVNATGDLTAEDTTITNIVAMAADGSPFDPGFDPGFGGGNGAFFANPPLWIVNGPNIPVNTRLTSALGFNAIIMDQPATASVIGATLTFAQDTYPEPADFDRFINQTWWDRTNRWALLGPDSPQVDQWHRSGVVTTGPRRHFRQIGYNGLTGTQGPVNCYRLWPPPAADNTPIDIAFEYISTYMVLSATGTPQNTFTADTDIPILDPNIFVLGTKWRYFQIKGFDYAPLQAEYQDYCDRSYGNDGGAKTLSLSGARANFLLNTLQVPDGNWGTGSSGV